MQRIHLINFFSVNPKKEFFLFSDPNLKFYVKKKLFNQIFHAKNLLNQKKKYRHFLLHLINKYIKSVSYILLLFTMSLSSLKTPFYSICCFSKNILSPLRQLFNEKKNTAISTMHFCYFRLFKYLLFYF